MQELHVTSEEEITYEIHYTYEPVFRETREQPAEGGAIIHKVFALFPTNGPYLPAIKVEIPTPENMVLYRTFMNHIRYEEGDDE